MIQATQENQCFIWQLGGSNSIDHIKLIEIEIKVSIPIIQDLFKSIFKMNFFLHFFVEALLKMS